MNEQEFRILVQPARVTFRVRGDTIEASSRPSIISVQPRRVTLAQRPTTLQVRPYRAVFKILEGQRGLPGADAVREVYYQDTDPVVTQPSINFKRGFFPVHPDIPTLLVFKP